ncbi:TraK family protein [Azohydromonas lata]|uniref:TraK family protein n=1 Tax=Azohydromonas lata TaxID=45677 RepID=UPI0012F5205B|nr:TraK family protein [Azohydromonas lata]
MTKPPAHTYVDELTSWVKQSAEPRPRRDRSLVAFLAVKEDVRNAIDARFPLKTIWQHMTETGRLTCRYETFLTHVKAHITDAPAPKAGGSAKSSHGSQPEPRRTNTSVPGFTYQPAKDPKDIL